MNYNRIGLIKYIFLLYIFTAPAFALDCALEPFVKTVAKEETLIYARIISESTNTDKTLKVEVLSILSGNPINQIIEIDRLKWDFGERYTAASEWLFKIRPSTNSSNRYWFSLCASRLRVEDGKVKGWINSQNEDNEQVMDIKTIRGILKSQKD